MRQLRLNSGPSIRIAKIAELLLLLTAIVFLALHAIHLSADFPNHSPWMDWAKYTDEGWYGDAAIRYFQRGHWYVPGDFNPAAALPVWPLLEATLFRFTGVNLIAARALTVGIFGLILLATYLLLRRWQTFNTQPGSREEKNVVVSFVPALAVLLLAVNPFCYVFTRMAILEPLLILFTLLALLCASYVERQQETILPSRLRYLLPVLALGFLLPLMVLTKTTAVFLIPAVAWILWVRAGYALRPFLRLAFPPAALAVSLWLGYYLLVIRPHFLVDFHYLFDANGYTKITVATAFSVLSDTFADGLWMGKILYPLALLAAVLVLVIRRHRRNPLTVALLLWIVGYAAFLAYHDNLQPRYYLVIAVPLTLLVPVVFAGWNRARRYRLVTVAAVALLAVSALTDARQTLHYVLTPEYTFTSAADNIQHIVASDRTHNPLVLSISGSNLSLMTGLPSICDDFGTLDLPFRVRAYHPGWYVAWNHIEDDKMEALAPMYHLQRVAAFPALDDPERNLLILYRLDPIGPVSPPHPRRKLSIPHLLQTSFGQQPSRIQLEH